MVFRKMPACWFPTHAGAGIGAGLVISKRKEIDGNKWSYGGKKTLTPPLPNCFSLRPATVGSPTGAGSRKMGSNCGYSIQLDLILLYRHFHHAAPTYASWPPHLCFFSLSLVPSCPLTCGFSHSHSCTLPTLPHLCAGKGHISAKNILPMLSNKVSFLFSFVYNCSHFFEKVAEMFGSYQILL